MKAWEKERHQQGKPRAETAIRTRKEVAEIMTERGYPMGTRAVEMTEHRALWKLRLGLIDVGNEALDQIEDEPDVLWSTLCESF